jgi:hypothetical protein
MVKKWLVMIVALAVVSALACTSTQGTPATSNTSPIQDSAQFDKLRTGQGPASRGSEVDQAKDRLAALLMDREGIVGVGVGQCNQATCLLVFVEEQTPELAQVIPDEFEGSLVEVEETGEVTAPPQ